MTMKHISNKQAFTLIEVIVAASILSITVFGVYKLIGENTKLISNNEQYSFANTLFSSLQECIEYLGFAHFNDAQSYSFNFWASGTECATTWNHPILLDGIEYTLSWTTTKTTTEIEWILEVSADTIQPITKNYIQLP